MRRAITIGVLAALALMGALIFNIGSPDCAAMHARTRAELGRVGDAGTLSDVIAAEMAAKDAGCGRDPHVVATFAAINDRARLGF